MTDTAGQTVEKDTLVSVSPDGMNVALIPESTKLVAGLDNEIDLFVTDPLGAPIGGAPTTRRASTPIGRCRKR